METMRRLLSPVRLLVIPDDGGLAPLLPPPLFLGFSHRRIVSPLGWGVAAVPPQPLFGGDARGDDS